MNFFSDIEMIYGDLARFKGHSWLGISPGEIISFDYEGKKRVGLVVSSKRTSSGVFLSSRNNNLVNVFLLDSLSQAMIELTVNILYRNVIRCSYLRTTKIIGAFLGNTFRTFNISKIDNLKILEISK